VKEKLFERVLPAFPDHALAHLVEAAQVCDGLVKGLKHPGWPLDAWEGLKRLALLVMQHTAATGAGRGLRPPLALGA
jgi:DNA polymerase-3 subunit delta